MSSITATFAVALSTVVARVAEGLGVTGKVEARLYKLLIYDQGSFFVRHRDTEKSKGMFATLIVVVPSLSAGGELVVRHKEREVRLDLRCDEPSDIVFAAFYADCVHEVLPVTAGYRLALVYNLVRPGRGALPEPPHYAAQEKAVAELLRRWTGGLRSPDGGEPQKLIYPLEHAYTPAELSFQALKGADDGIARVVAVPTHTMTTQRDRHLAAIAEHGRIAWQRCSGYSRRSLVETAMYRYKTIIGRRLHARILPSQRTEAKIACNVVNRMTSLGMPLTGRVA